MEIWLQKLYGEQQIPSYEINQQTIGILYDLMKKNEQQDEWTAALIADLQQKTDEYNVEGKKLYLEITTTKSINSEEQVRLIS